MAMLTMMTMTIMATAGNDNAANDTDGNEAN